MTKQKQPMLGIQKERRAKQALLCLAAVAGLWGAAYFSGKAIRNPETENRAQSSAVYPATSSLDKPIYIGDWDTEILENMASRGITPTNGYLTERIVRGYISTLDAESRKSLNLNRTNPAIQRANPETLENKTDPAPKTNAPAYSSPKTLEFQESPNIADPKREYPITQEFIAALIKRESRGNPKAVSDKGAAGIMQIMPETWAEQTRKLYGRELPFSQAYNPQVNKEVGTNYLREIHETLATNLPGYPQKPVHEKQALIAASYNGGQTRLLRKGGDISRMPRETREYVRIIRSYLNPKS